MGRILALPFVALWRLATFVVELTGRILAVAIGLVLVVIGIALSLTIVGAIAGIPLIFAGTALILKGLLGA